MFPSNKQYFLVLLALSEQPDAIPLLQLPDKMEEISAREFPNEVAYVYGPATLAGLVAGMNSNGDLKFDRDVTTCKITEQGRRELASIKTHLMGATAA